MISNKTSYTPGEVAQLQGCSTKTVRLAILRGELQAYRLNARVILVPSHAIAAWLDRAQANAKLRLIRGSAGAQSTASGPTGRKRRNSG